ncbi:alpha/beta hydrolase [Aeromicrobium sp. IC_218]|uniref:alpha/beta fold hydrolase n=1 Tax=Aeromicrobium sp. IC_218 TaxID=2545468 RepID=UPI0010387E06|nr:alpha/beta hydrolase [Aeromicrobium sp. IC_218]TCI98821.1 alpha/beta hydrolase [Aeromicrobium sp. IC_218]
MTVEPGVLPVPYVVRRGEGMPLVTLHGNGVDHRLLLGLDDVLAGTGPWERIYPDLAGFGRTPALEGAGGLPELADWVVAMVRDLVGERPFALLASSLGGLLARHVVAAMPQQVRGIALLAPVVDPVPSGRTLPPFRVLERDEELLASLDDADRVEFEGMTTRQVREVWDLFRDGVMPGVRTANAEAMARLWENYALAAPEDSFAQPCEAPTLVVTGRQDHIVGYVDQLALLEHYPRATYLLLDAAGHNPQLERRCSSRTPCATGPTASTRGSNPQLKAARVVASAGRNVSRWRRRAGTAGTDVEANQW